MRHPELFEALGDCRALPNTANNLYQRINVHKQAQGHLALGSPADQNACIDEYIAAYMMIVDREFAIQLIGSASERAFRQLCCECRDNYNRRINGDADPVREVFRTTWDMIHGGHYSMDVANPPPEGLDPLLAGLNIAMTDDDREPEEEEEEP